MAISRLSAARLITFAILAVATTFAQVPPTSSDSSSQCMDGLCTGAGASGAQGAFGAGFGTGLSTTGSTGTTSGTGTTGGAGASQGSYGNSTIPPMETINIIDGDRPTNPSAEETAPQNRVAFPREPKTEFQKFVVDATGADLSIYGQNLFGPMPTTFAPLDRMPVPADYTVGPGDELVIRVWGQVNVNARLTVDRSGQVFLPKVGTVNVAGVRFDEMTPLFRRAIGAIYRNFDVTVTLGQLRSIQVFVVGHARRPGSYTVSSFSTLVNAVFASGGPTSTGSLRDIQLRRGDQVVTHFDFYELLAHGDKSKDRVLQPGDVIYIPPVGPMVAMVGSVNSPAIYELRNDSTLREELAIAGGLSTTADTGRVSMERIDKRATRRIIESPLDDETLGRKLQDGDVVRIFPVSPKIENVVTLRGNVAQPGRYSWRQSMRIRDLIPSREFLITRDYWTQQNALGMSPNGWDGKAGPANGGCDDGSTPGTKAQAAAGLQSRAANTTAPAQNTAPRTAATRQQTPCVPGQLRESLLHNAAEINWDYAVIQRLNTDSDLSTQLLSFNLGHAISDPDSEDNLVLKPGDVVTIFSQRDLAVPREKQTKYVRLEGEVKAAGVYRVEPGETLRDLVQRAGGLTSNAYLYAADFRRESARIEQQKELDRLVTTMDKSLQQAEAAVHGADASGQIAAQRKMLDKMTAATATGRVVLEIRPTDKTLAAVPPIPLEDGDRLFIPARPGTVEVVGAVFNQNSYLYRDGKRVRDYLREAGGSTPGADKKRILVVRANGAVLGKKPNTLWSSGVESALLMPGDSVIVPDKVKVGATMTALKDWSQLMSQFALGAAAFTVLVP